MSSRVTLGTHIFFASAGRDPCLGAASPDRKENRGLGKRDGMGIAEQRSGDEDVISLLDVDTTASALHPLSVSKFTHNA